MVIIALRDPQLDAWRPPEPVVTSSEPFVANRVARRSPGRPTLGSVTEWLVDLKAGDREAAEKLWQRYFSRLVHLARNRLGGIARGVADEEDVALSALKSFYAGAAHDRFPHLDDRDNLWQILVTLTARKAADLATRERCAKRGGGMVRVQPVHRQFDDSSAASYGLDQIIGQDPTPEMAAVLSEECDRLFNQPRDESLRTVARWKMEGYTNAEIATKLGTVTRTVERKLRLIRSIWQKEDVR